MNDETHKAAQDDALISEAREMLEHWATHEWEHKLVSRLADALEQKPSADRSKLARALFIADNWGVPSGGADWDEGRVNEYRIAQMYRLADGILASGILLDSDMVAEEAWDEGAAEGEYVTNPYRKETR